MHAAVAGLHKVRRLQHRAMTPAGGQRAAGGAQQGIFAILALCGRQPPAAAPLTRTGLWHKERGEHGHCTVGIQVAFDTLILIGFIYMLAALQ